MLALSLQADLCVMTWLLGYVDPLDPSFVAAVLTIAFNPLYWNVVSDMPDTVQTGVSHCWLSPTCRGSRRFPSRQLCSSLPCLSLAGVEY